MPPLIIYGLICYWLMKLCYNFIVIYMSNFILKNWNNEEVIKLDNYLYSIRVEDKIVWGKNIVNTNMDYLAIKLPILKNIAKDIYKGDYISYLDLMPHKYFESCTIDAFLISFIKDFKLQTKYIKKLSKYIDNWSVVDSLKFSIKGNEESYVSFAKELLQSKEPFTRRIGVRIFFSFVKIEKYHQDIFNILDGLFEEEHYYVNMAAAWLLCEMFIHFPNEIFAYLNKHHTNKFIINKGISKCRDSFRVSQENKDKLLKYKIK